MNMIRHRKVRPVASTCALLCLSLLCIRWYMKDPILKTSKRSSDSREEPARNRSFPSAVKNLRSRNIFYNRVAKCGSRSLMRVVRKLAERNDFEVRSSEETGDEHPENLNQLQEAMKVGALQPPTFYDRHIHYFDIRKYGMRQPVYINMIRDPLDRFTSHYNYLKYGDERGWIKDLSQSHLEDINDCVMSDGGFCNSNVMFYTGMYFCGMDPTCTKPAPERVRIAKKHIDEEYLVVGITEEFENTLRLFEVMMPEYFEGAVEEWERAKKFINNTATKRGDFLNDEAKEKLIKHNLADEYKIYYHVKRKFNSLKNKYGIS